MLIQAHIKTLVQLACPVPFPMGNVFAAYNIIQSLKNKTIKIKIMDRYVTSLIPILPSAWEWDYCIIPTDLSFLESYNLKKKNFINILQTSWFLLNLLCCESAHICQWIMYNEMRVTAKMCSAWTVCRRPLRQRSYSYGEDALWIGVCLHAWIETYHIHSWTAIDYKIPTP